MHPAVSSTGAGSSSIRDKTELQRNTPNTNTSAVLIRAGLTRQRGGLGGGLVVVSKSAPRGGASFGFALRLTAKRPSEARQPRERAAKKAGN